MQRGQALARARERTSPARACPTPRLLRVRHRSRAPRAAPILRAMESSARESTFRRALIVANPIAGSGRARRSAEELERELARAGLATKLHFTDARGDARAQTARHGREFDVVVAVGGDGTVAEVLEGLPSCALPVAILPLGTANVMSLDLALPRGAQGAARMILAGRTSALDVARVVHAGGERISFLVTGAGEDALIVRELERLRRGPITKRTWVRAGVNALLRTKPPRLTIRLDGREIPGEFCQVLFSNIIHYGGFRVLADERRIDDGTWELYTFPARSRLGVVAYGVQALLRGFPSGRVVRQLGRRLEVDAQEPTPFQVDGDLAGVTPFSIEVVGEQRRLVVP